MFWRSLGLLGFFFVSSSLPASAPKPIELRDLYFGEALYRAYQGDHFDAIARLDTELGQYYGLDEPELDSLNFHIGQAEFSVGDFELSYRMHHRAGRAIRAVLEGNVDQSVRNEAAYRLARIYFQKDQPINALDALERIEGKVPEHIRDDIAFLRAQIYMANGRFADAVEILKGLLGSGSYEGFTAYNLGIALLKDGQEGEAHRQLEKAGQIGSSNPATLAIKDKANLALGTKLLESTPELSKKYLDRVRLEGPFSNKALLGLGWADASAGDFARALVPWSILTERNVTDKAVQEALLAVPYAYGKLNVHGKAALMYGSALEAFGEELAKLDASIKSIRDGKFFQALVREELKQDKNWVVKLRNLPETPETYYLMELMASHDFQESLKNYLDLEELRKKIATWLEELDAYEEMISLRRAYYQPLLPEIDRQFRILDSQMKLRLEQRQRLAQRLESMLVLPRPDFLATADERIIRERLEAIKRQTKNDEARAETRYRVKRLEGVLHWHIHTEYDKRLTDAYKHLLQLDEDIEALIKRYHSFVRTRQAATQSYEGYERTIHPLRANLFDAQEEVKALMVRQGRMLEVMAVNELDQRRARLEEYHIKARFAVADSYDRAAMSQDAGAGGK
jgi:hypothetical protein